jgi:hypothetical protein
VKATRVDVVTKRLAARPPAPEAAGPPAKGVPFTVRARFNYRTGVALLSVLLGLSLGAGIPWGRPSAIGATVFVLVGVALAFASVAPSITFTAHSVQYFNRFGRTNPPWNLDDSSRLVYRQEIYLNRLGLHSSGTLELQHRENGHWSEGLALPRGRYGSEADWAALLLQAAQAGRLTATAEAVAQLNRMSTRA